MTELLDLFEAPVVLPDDPTRRRYDALVGIDDNKQLAVKHALTILAPHDVEAWSRHRHGGRVLRAAELLLGRPPLLVFAGDVGTGKTALAETFGDAVARQASTDVLVFSLSLSARGSGAVGEMTRLISSAFGYVRDQFAPVPAGASAPRAGILLIDEADALAQSRELAQMHHEDRAGVNALIRGIDMLSDERRPVLVVMSTNRVGALDPAVQRRAAAIIPFDRPDDHQRRDVLLRALVGVSLTEPEIDELVALTGPREGRAYGYTYSDLTTRLVPGAVLAAYPDHALDFETIRDHAQLPPTPPFGGES